MPFPRFISDERGFTIVEVMVAAALLLTGLVATMSMLNSANASTTTTKAREQGVSLQREIVEAARSISYAELTPESIVARIQRMDGLGDDNGSTEDWKIRRRGITYSVTLGTCSVDDAADGTGAQDAARFCTTGPGKATAATCRTLLGTEGSVAGTGASDTAAADCGIDSNRDGTVDGLVAGGSCGAGCGSGTDSNPDDYKRIVSLVRWDRGSGARYALQAATLPNPGLSASPGVATITPERTNVLEAGIETLNIGVTTTRPAATVGISIDGSPLGSAAVVGSDPKVWNYPWRLGALASPIATATDPADGEVLDGTYVVSARALDAYGSAGTTRAATVTINRRIPYPVKRFRAGRRGGNSGDIDFEWVLNRERDIVGYRVFRDVPNTDVDEQACALTRRTACFLANPPEQNSEYYAVAYDRNSAGGEQVGSRSPNFLVTKTNTVPAAVTALEALSVSGGNTKLNWAASAGDPDAGDSVDHYRIYRDGVAYANRYDRTSTGAVLEYLDTDAGGTPHDYWVAAVDQSLGESTLFGPVRR